MLVDAINVLLFMVAGVVLLPIGVFALECVVAAIFGPSREAAGEHPRPTVAVLIPAHNEEQSIAGTIQTVLPQLGPGDRVVVVADNCTDSTASVARDAGAVVIERHDDANRGKGFALDFGIEFLSQQPPQVVFFVDADCEVISGTVDRLARAAAQHNRPVQSSNLLEPPVDPGPRDLISSFAFMVRNLVRPVGLQRLGMPCLLMGTGMAMPWELARQAPLASGNIVEDMQLGIDLAVLGYPALLCVEGGVRGRLPKGQAAATQRKRWEHGHLRTILTQVPRLLLAAIVQRRIGLLGLALDLMVPPLSLLVMLWAVLWGLSAASWLAGFSRYPFVMASAGGVLLALAVLLAWARFARDLLPLRSLLAAPVYAAWKLPLYLAFAISREKRWIRTERGGGGPGPVP